MAKAKDIATLTPVSKATGLLTAKELRTKIMAEYGNSVIGEGLDVDFDYQYIPTGIFSLDKDLGGGIVRGKRYCLWGETGSGKSTVMCRIAGEFQKRCRVCNQTLVDCAANLEKDHEPTPMHVAYFNLEKSLDKNWAAANGWDVDDCSWIEPDYLEELLDIVDEFVTNAAADLILIDSLAALPTKRATAKSSEDASAMAEKASKFLDINNWIAHQKSFRGLPKITILAINQLRNDVRPVAHGKAYDPGGNNLRHAWDTKIRFKKEPKLLTMTYEQEEITIGAEITYDTGKNRLYVPYRKGSFKIYGQDDPSGRNAFFRGGTDNNKAIIDYAARKGLITKVGDTWEVFGFEDTFKTRSALDSFLWDNPQNIEHLAHIIISDDRRVSLGENK